LRAISILIVLLSHTGYGTIVPGGLGVTIFFFLSGYLITTLLVEESERTVRSTFGKFYLRRAFRLFSAARGNPCCGIFAGNARPVGRGHFVGRRYRTVAYFANYYGLFFDPGNTTAAARAFYGP
jgi:peptidoglycan/LPS O-acetylase OafA/YrhL